MLKHPFFHPGVHPTATCQVGKQNSSTGETRSAYADGSQLQFAAVIWSADQIQDGCWHHTGPELNSENMRSPYILYGMYQQKYIYL